MFTKLSPQKVRCSDGYIVQVRDRHSVEYVEDGRSAVVEVEFGGVISVYAHTLSDWHVAGGQAPMAPSERADILGRISAGLTEMGSRVEVV